jgi:hypothetical protein
LNKPIVMTKLGKILFIKRPEKPIERLEAGAA